MLAALLRPRRLPVLLLVLLPIHILFWHLHLLPSFPLSFLPSLPLTLSTPPPPSRDTPYNDYRMDKDLSDLLRESLANLPEAYMYRSVLPSSSPPSPHCSNEVQKMVNSSCARFPNLLDIQFGNIYWQVPC